MDLSNLAATTDDYGNVIYTDMYSGQNYSVADVAYAMQTQASGTLPASQVDWLSSLTNITDGAKSLITALNSYQLQQINIKRAQQGLTPLNPALYAPQVGVNFSSGTMGTLMWIALGLGAVMLLKRR